jgi:hypothetical protein
MSDTIDYSDACYNCGTTLTGPFCAACGQKVQELDPSLKHFLHDLTHELLHFDGKIYRSVLRCSRDRECSREIISRDASSLDFADPSLHGPRAGRLHDHC